MEPVVIYEEKDFLVINKPAGLLVHDSGFTIHDSGMTVTSWLLKNYPEVATVGDAPETRPGIVHRLDKDTSGVMIIPRTQEAFEYFKNLFQIKEIKKTYCALVYGKPKELQGIINKPIGLSAGTVKRTVHTQHAKMVKEAITKYRVQRLLTIYRGPTPIDCALVEVEPLTGRTHQIRVHLASIGYPVVGDTLYGPKKQLIPLGRQFLHADSIEFRAPSGKRLTISADLPAELEDILKEA